MLGIVNGIVLLSITVIIIIGVLKMIDQFSSPEPWKDYIPWYRCPYDGYEIEANGDNPRCPRCDSPMDEIK